MKDRLIRGSTQCSTFAISRGDSRILFKATERRFSNCSEANFFDMNTLITDVLLPVMHIGFLN